MTFSFIMSHVLFKACKVLILKIRAKILLCDYIYNAVLCFFFFLMLSSLRVVLDLWK